MKRIIYSLLIFTTAFIFTSCEDEDKDPFMLALIEDGAFVRFDDIASSSITPTANYQATLVAPSNNVASYDLTVSHFNGETATEFKPLLSLNSFPATLDISLGDVASALGISPDAIQPGDRIDFVATVTGTDGTVFKSRPADESDLGDDVFGNPGERQAFEFTSFVVCGGFSPSEAAGTYVITRDDFGVTFPGDDLTFEVVAGPGENQITLIDPFGYPQAWDVVVTVDLETETATVEQQTAWDSGAFGLPYGIGTVDGDGLAFSCSGFITLGLNYRVAAGSFGLATIEFTKQ